MASVASNNASEMSPLLSREPSAEFSGSQPHKWIIRIALPAVVMLYFFGYIVSIIVLNPFVYDTISKEFPHFNATSRHPCTKDMHKNGTENRSDITTQNEIQKRVSTFELHVGMVSFTLAVIPVLCLGPLSDRYGRKLGFAFPIVATGLKQVVYCLVIGLNLPLELLFLGNIFESLGGGFATMLMSMFSTISDVTPPGKGRSLAFTFMEGLQTITAAISQVTMSRWMRTSYMYPLVCALTLEVFALTMTLTVLPDTMQLIKERTRQQQGRSSWRDNPLCKACLGGFTRVKNTFTLYLYDTEGRLAKRRLSLAVFMLTVAVNFSKSGVQTLYLMKYPMCWSNLKVIVFSGVQLAVNWVVIWLLLVVLQTFLKMKDRHVTLLGCVSSFVACVFMSLASTDVMVYEVAALGVMTRAIIPMTRSTISALVDSTDQGAVFAGMGFIETLGAGVFGLAANRIYFATLASFAGSIFLVFAAIMLLAIVLQVIVSILFAREESSPPSRCINSDDE